MIRLDTDFEPTMDLNAVVDGFLESRQLSLYERSDIIPTLDGVWVEPPLLMVEVLDDRHTELFDSTTGRQIVLLKPLCAISISQAQCDFIKKYFKGD